MTTECGFAFRVKKAVLKPVNHTGQTHYTCLYYMYTLCSEVNGSTGCIVCMHCTCT